MSAPGATLAALLALALLGAAAGCGSGEQGRRAASSATATVAAPTGGAPTRAALRAGDLSVRHIGRGPASAWVIARRSPAPSRATVLFLHGWGATLPRFYGPWLAHLARKGDLVIYPRYQASVLTPPAQTLGNAVLGLRRALAATRRRPRPFVVAGHSAGGALSADYAALAPQLGLPEPRAVLAVYPGRSFTGDPVAIKEAAPSLIPKDTRLEVLAGADDRAVGDRDAKRIYSAPDQIPRSRRSYTVIRARGADDHGAPQRATAISRRVFWGRLDRLVARVSGRGAG